MPVMTTSELRQRPLHGPIRVDEIIAATSCSSAKQIKSPHPAGKAIHGRFVAILRCISLSAFVALGHIVVNATQLLGAPLYYISRDFYHAYMAQVKQSYGVLLTVMTQWWAPAVIRISGDDSVAGQLSVAPDGRVECKFPERMVMIANHQIYTDWLYLWWVGYTNIPAMHGHIYIILKESIKWLPIVGSGAYFFDFIFMSRKWIIDQPRLARRLGKLKQDHIGPNGKIYLDPMWLLLFPEGTNISDNGRVKSANWAAKTGVKDCQHMMLPRSTGTFFILNELKGTVDYVYDSTVAYEGVPRGDFAEQYFTIWSSFFEGRPPKSVNFYWRRFALADMPLHDAQEFDKWLRERWYEKDALMEQYMTTGRFPANGAGAVVKGHIETQLRTKYRWEFLSMFVMLGCFVLSFNLIFKTLNSFRDDA